MGGQRWIHRISCRNGKRVAPVDPLSFSTPWAGVENLSCLFLPTRPEHDLSGLWCRHPGTLSRVGTQVNKNWHLLSAYSVLGAMLHSLSHYFHTVLWSRRCHYPPFTDEQTSLEKLSVLSPTQKDSKIWKQAVQRQCLVPVFDILLLSFFHPWSVTHCLLSFWARSQYSLWVRIS